MPGLTAARIIELLEGSFRDRRVRLRRSYGTRHRPWDVQRRIARNSETGELIKVLQQSTNSRVAGLICYTLGHRQAKEAVPILIERLNDESIRFEVVDALCHIEDPRAGEPLLELFQKEENPGMRRLYALSLGVCHCRQATSALVEALKDPDSAVRGYAAISLGRIGAQEAEAAIRQTLAIESEGYDAQLMRQGLEILEAVSGEQQQ